MRSGGRDDHAFVHDLGVRSSLTSVAALREADEAGVVLAFEGLLAFVQRRDHDVLIAEADGVAAGFLVLLYDVPDEVTGVAQAFVAYTAVEPAQRRRGLGAALMREAERRTRERGLRYVSLMVTEENAAARALYAGAGFATERRMLTKVL